MTALDAYEKLLLKVNRNDTNTNIHVPRGKFVVVYNEQRHKWLAEKLEDKINSIDLDDISELLVEPTPLEKLSTERDYVSFKLPDDFFGFSSSYSLASKGECSARPIINWNTKSRDLPWLLKDKNHDPSFEYEETLLSIASNKVRVYFSDFTIDEAYLSYYREPKAIDVAGYVKLDGTPSQDINPDLSDMLVDEIISRCAAEIMRNNQNGEGFQFAKDRIQSER